MGIDINSLRTRREARREEKSAETTAQSDPIENIVTSKGIDIAGLTSSLRNGMKQVDDAGKHPDGKLDEREMTAWLKNRNSGTSGKSPEFPSGLAIPIEELLNAAKVTLTDLDRNRDGYVSPKEMPADLAKDLQYLTDNNRSR